MSVVCRCPIISVHNTSTLNTNAAERLNKINISLVHCARDVPICCRVRNVIVEKVPRVYLKDAKNLICSMYAHFIVLTVHVFLCEKPYPKTRFNYIRTYISNIMIIYNTILYCVGISHNILCFLLNAIDKRNLFNFLTIASLQIILYARANSLSYL